MHLEITKLEKAAQGVLSVTLTSPDGSDLPVWEPGAHIDLILAPRLIRQYSLCGDPKDKHSYFVSVLREVDGRGGSAHVHDKLRVGQLVEVSEPRNNFEIDGSDSYILIAGGIGITPILAMVRQLNVLGRRWKLFYGGRSRSSMAFLPELEALGENVTIIPQDEAGIIPVSQAVSEARGGLVYCCGPEPLIKAVEDECQAQGVVENLRVERFSAAPQVFDDSENRSFVVELKSSGLEVSIPEDRTILDCLLDEGVDVAFSCEEGACGTCQVDVLSGEVDHRDSILAKDEENRMMICVSRAKSDRLILDI